MVTADAVCLMNVSSSQEGAGRDGLDAQGGLRRCAQGCFGKCTFVQQCIPLIKLSWLRGGANLLYSHRCLRTGLPRQINFQGSQPAAHQENAAAHGQVLGYSACAVGRVRTIDCRGPHEDGQDARAYLRQVQSSAVALANPRVW